MRFPRLVAGVAALSLALTACGGGDDDAATDADTPAATETTDDAATSEDGSTDSETSDDMSQSASANPFADLKTAAQAVGNNGTAKANAMGLDQALDLEGDVESPAAQTYATLSTLLQEHVYLSGIAVDAAYSFGPESPQFEAAAGVLDENSVELADVVGSVAPDQRDAFLELWRQHIGFFVDYALAAANDDQAGIDQAIEDLRGYGEQSGAFFEQISGGAIPASAVQQSLDKHIDTLGAAIEALAAGTTDAFDKLKAAAEAVAEDGSAKALAAGLDQALDLEGDVESPAAQTYTNLSTLLEEHVYLAGIAVRTAYGAGLDSEAFAASAATLDANSVELADVIGSVAPDQRDAFLELWRQHIGFFVDYAKGAAGGDEQVKEQALNDLAGYGEQAGAFFEEISGGAIPASAVKESLAKHVDTLSTAIDSFAAALTS